MACATSTVSYALSLAELEGIVTAWGLSSSGAGKRPGAEAQALRGSLDELVRAHTIIVADAYKLILIAVMIQLSSGYLSAEYVLGKGPWKERAQARGSREFTTLNSYASEQRAMPVDQAFDGGTWLNMFYQCLAMVGLQKSG
jgi:hypothetical protein